MVTTVVMMTQHVAADISSAAAPSEHLNTSGQHMAVTPCGSSVVFSPTKLREEEKKIQMVSSILASFPKNKCHSCAQWSELKAISRGN